MTIPGCSSLFLFFLLFLLPFYCSVLRCLQSTPPTSTAAFRVPDRRYVEPVSTQPLQGITRSAHFGSSVRGPTEPIHEFKKTAA